MHTSPVRFRPRLIAFLLDIVMTVLIAALFSNMVIFLPPLSQVFPELKYVDESIFILLPTLLSVALIEALTGYTPGKFLLRIRAGTVDGKEGTILFYTRRFLARNFYMASSFLLMFIADLLSDAGVYQDLGAIIGALEIGLVLVFAGGCLAALRSSRQALHDHWVASAVFKAHELQKNTSSSEL